MPDTGGRMFQITKPSDARLLAIAKRVARTVNLAAERAVAHHAHPGEFPMPAERGSLEALFLTHLQQQPADRQQRIVNRVLPRVRALTAERRARYGELVGIDLRSAKAVTELADQVPLPVQFTPQELTNLVERLGAEFTGSQEPLRAVPEE